MRGDTGCVLLSYSARRRLMIDMLRGWRVERASISSLVVDGFEGGDN